MDTATFSAPTRFTALLQRIRCAILPPKRSVFVGGRWIPVDPLYPGRATARFAGEDVPAWWILGCRRKATYVGIYDQKTWTHRSSPTNRGEIAIAHGIYQVSEEPLSDEQVGQLLTEDAELRLAA